ncbi:PREDICTED: putative F-box protein At3g10430 [Ipomoea nil]|uniref:putative F-box protein At3g10430 n=1 Tax=Ipomoea nil TaxID=35883 RepID=UPI0009011BA5|nr:PREDICTED: putative F-box protein At3g10430 [Ipomoea nil]
MENCKLPKDLVVDILARLSVKSLMQFKCVCKFFYDLITSDRHFLDKHYGISKAKTDYVLLETGWNVREYYLLYKESEGNEIECIYLDIPVRPKAQRWVKSCEGMLCLILTRKDVLNLDAGDNLIYDILIWNPFIRKIKALPPITVPYKLSYPAYALNAFGFGISNNMIWKVVMRLEICSLCDDGRKIVHQTTMVYSQVHGDSWSLRPINLVTSFLDREIQGDGFYLKGRYYWSEKSYFNGQYLLWFDMDDKVFGTIEFPSDVTIASVTIMDETIALLGYPSVGDFSCIGIWLMIENDNNTYWRKQTIVDCVVNADNNECWRPIGIWNAGTELLVFLDSTIAWDPFSDEMDVPYFISIDLVTQERKMFSISKERKCITMTSDQAAGYIQVYNERNTNIAEEWKQSIFMRKRIYARVYSESLHLL